MHALNVFQNIKDKSLSEVSAKINRFSCENWANLSCRVSTFVGYSHKYLETKSDNIPSFVTQSVYKLQLESISLRNYLGNKHTNALIDSWLGIRKG